MRFKPIHSLAALCVKHDIVHAIACPGSRCAPLTLAFLRNRQITARTFSDERSAGFIALGMASQTRSPVVLISTSGTAGLNFAPAVAEAFFQGIPLIVITADRPREWIGQQDGQTIFQHGMFGNHIKGTFELPQEYEHPDDQWAVNRMVNDAINLSRENLPGPVHINAPFREPLYPSSDDSPDSPGLSSQDFARKIEMANSPFHLDGIQLNALHQEWTSFHHILIVAGQATYVREMSEALSLLSLSHHVPVVTDITSNLQTLPTSVKHSDVFLGQATEDVRNSLQPDLLVTFGGSVVSKNLKVFLRKYPATAHWHIQASGPVADTFQQTTRVVRASPRSFFQGLSTKEKSSTFEHQKQENYYNLWHIESRRVTRSLSQFFPQAKLGEFELVYEVLKHLPASAHLHLANSMSVRYANFIGLTEEQGGVSVFSNRGTSGIDGCTSTAVGHCLASDSLHVLITGDMAFFYDRNAFWHNYPLANFRAVVLNNHGGAIFGMIDGPASLPEAEEYFITRQRRTARKLCEEFEFDYLLLDNRRKVKNYLADFFEAGDRAKVLEIETSVEVAQSIMKDFKAHIKNSYEG